MKKEDVYLIDDITFINTIKNSKNIHEALTKMGLNARGGAYKTFKRRCSFLSVDLSHFINEKELRKNILDNEIIFACNNTFSRQSALKFIKLNHTVGVNIIWLNKKIQQLHINIDHWTGQAHLKNKTHNWNNVLPLNEILVKNSVYTSNSSLKSRLLKSNLLEYKCSKCAIYEWLGDKLSLQLEHINGDNTDNRIENLTLLCPNCHSQTSTFAGKNIGKNK